jgi:hypothetical protein
MLDIIKAVLGSIFMAIVVGFFAVSGWLFVANGLDLLTVVLGWSMLGITFLLVTLAFLIAYRMGL